MTSTKATMKKYANIHRNATDHNPDVNHLIDIINELDPEYVRKSPSYYADDCINVATRMGYTDFKLVFSDNSFMRLIRTSPDLVRIEKFPLIGYRLYYRNIRVYVRYYGEDDYVIWVI